MKRILVRHSRKWTGETNQGDMLFSMRRKEVRRLLSYRGAIDPINSADLTLLLELRLNGMDAQRLAPWISGDGLDALIAEADNNVSYWRIILSKQQVKDKIGERLELSFDEFKACGGFKYIAPCDVDAPEVRHFWLEKKRRRDRNYKRQKRKYQRMRLLSAQQTPSIGRTQNLSERAQAIYNFLLGKNWISCPSIAKALQDTKCFRRSTGKPLHPDALRQAVRRAVIELTQIEKVEERVQQGKRGFLVRMVRIKICTLPEATDGLSQ